MSPFQRSSNTPANGLPTVCALTPPIPPYSVGRVGRALERPPLPTSFLARLDAISAPPPIPAVLAVRPSSSKTGTALSRRRCLPFPVTLIRRIAITETNDERRYDVQVKEIAEAIYKLVDKFAPQGVTADLVAEAAIKAAAVILISRRGDSREQVAEVFENAAAAFRADEAREKPELPN